MLHLQGKVFSRLTATDEVLVRRSKQGHRLWVCKCSCGNETVVRSDHLVSGHIKSCGCLLEVAEEYLPIIHLAFSNLKAWLKGTHHGRVEPKHLQAYLNEFTFRFNRRFWPFRAFRSLLGIGANGEAPTYDGLYSGEWKHPSIVKD